jgi:hypothetical protein
LLLGAIALYSAKGAEIGRYDHAAFSLTVFLYTLMSFINLVGNLITPECPACYLLRWQVMNKAEARGRRFDGAIGVLQLSVMEQSARLNEADTG